MIGSTKKPAPSNLAAAAKVAHKPAALNSLAEKRRQRKREKLDASLNKSG